MLIFEDELAKFQPSTEIEQAEDLIRYINTADENNGIWETNIFGKTIRQLVDEGIHSKVNRLTEESQLKLQDTIQSDTPGSNHQGSRGVLRFREQDQRRSGFSFALMEGQAETQSPQSRLAGTPVPSTTALVRSPVHVLLNRTDQPASRSG